MSRAAWAAAERAFNRREPLPQEYEMGTGRWSKRSVGGEERHSIEFGFKFRFDVRAVRRNGEIIPGLWFACSRDGALGEFPTFDTAAQACEDEARRLIEPALEKSDVEYEMKLIGEEWKAYLAKPRRFKSVKVHTRYK